MEWERMGVGGGAENMGNFIKSFFLISLLYESSF